MSEHHGSLLKSALGGKCPHCGKGKLYKGPLKIADHCANCGLDYGFEDSGDGPVVFVIMIVGFIATGGVLYTEFTFDPPFWLLALIWGPLTILLCLAFLYWFKGAMLAQQFYTKAEQGQRVDANK